MNVVAAAKYAVENPAWLREHVGDSVALKSNGFRYLSTGGLYLHGVHAGKLEEEAMRHGEFLGKIAPHFAEVRAKAIALGVNPNGDGIVHNDLQQFLDDIPDWLREFYEELPAEAQRAFRMAYAGGEYWQGERDHEQLVVGENLVALVENGNLAAAQWLALALHDDPSYAYEVALGGVEGVLVAMLGGGTTVTSGSESSGYAAIEDVVIFNDEAHFAPSGQDLFRGLSIDAQRVNTSNTTIFQDALGWYNVNAPMPQMSFTTRHDSLAGKLFLGLVQRLETEQNDPGAQIVTALYAEAITNIPAWEILARVRNDGTVNVDGMKLLFGESQSEYDNLFNQEIVENTTPAVLTANVDKDVYTEGKILVRFDLLSEGKILDYVEIFRPGEETTIIANRIGGSRNRLFVEVPVESMAMNGENTYLQLVAHFTDGTKVQGVTEGFSVEMQSSANPLAQELIGQETWNQLSASQQAEIISSFDFGNLDPESSNGKIIQYLIDEYLRSGEMSFNAQKMEWIGTAYFDDPNNTDDDLVGECKYWIQINVVQQATQKLIPNNDPNSHYMWRTDDPDRSANVSIIAQSDDSSNFKNTVTNGNIHFGDIIQYDAGGYGHTVIIGKVDEDGMWVFDSNYLNDSTPRYHKISFASFNQIHGFTIYHVN